MSDRLRNNLIAGLVIFAFWCVSFSAIASDPIVTDSTSVVTSTGTQTTTVKSPPPSAIAPQFGSGNNSDLCTISSSGSVQTQILGLSVGTTYTEDNCLRLKKAQKLYLFGMKVAAVSVMCQDPDVWKAMMSAGTPCPIDGLIGQQAKDAWAVQTSEIPMPKDEHETTAQEKRDKALSIMGTIVGAFMFF
jgi:ribulose 1,5-bisphosphate synthetase/thiazole synthase